MYFDIHMQFLNTDNVARQVAVADLKLQTSHHDGEKKGWDWDKFVTLHKDHSVMESLSDSGCSGMDNGTQFHHFLQGIKSTELEAAVNIVQAQPEKYGTDFDITVSYLGKMVTKKGSPMQSVGVAKTGSWPVRCKVAAFMGKV